MYGNGQHENVGENRQARRDQVLHWLVIAAARDLSVPVFVYRHAGEDGGEQNRNHEGNVGPVQDLDGAPETEFVAAKSEQEEQNRRLDEGQFGIVQHDDDIIENFAELGIEGARFGDFPDVDAEILGFHHVKQKHSFNRRQKLYHVESSQRPGQPLSSQADIP